jgi:hypothetical protein
MYIYKFLYIYIYMYIYIYVHTGCYALQINPSYQITYIINRIVGDCIHKGNPLKYSF